MLGNSLYSWGSWGFEKRKRRRWSELRSVWLFKSVVSLPLHMVISALIPASLTRLNLIEGGVCGCHYLPPPSDCEAEEYVNFPQWGFPTWLVRVAWLSESHAGGSLTSFSITTVCVYVCVCVCRSVYICPSTPEELVCPLKKINNLGTFTFSNHKLYPASRSFKETHGYGYILQTWMIWLIAMSKSVPHTDRARKRETQIAGSSLHTFLTLSLQCSRRKKKNRITFICYNAMSYFPLSIQG